MITLDQFRGDSLSCAGHPLVRTPNIDHLAAHGVRFARHYTQATPCSPGRASLYTGTYQMNNRVVANGTPLDHRLDNIARLSLRAGVPGDLFGYTDQAVDPRVTESPDDPRLLTYEELLPGLTWRLNLSGTHRPWLDFLAAHGYDTSAGHMRMLATENERPVEHSVSRFMTDVLITHLATIDGDQSFFVHASYLRPHPPYSAAGEYSRMYPPDAVGRPIPPEDDPHPFHQTVLDLPDVRAPVDEAAIRRQRAQYYGMISHIDAEMGRLWDAMERLGLWDDTTVIITADHGEMNGDHGLQQKLGWWEESHHVPLIWRDPSRPHAHGRVVDRFTEHVDVMPTLAESWDQPVPRQCDGFPLTPFLDDGEPPVWRDAASWEFDWRYALIALVDDPWPWDRRLETYHLAVHRTADTAYVQFGDGSYRCYDLAADPTWRTPVHDTARILDMAQRMLLWRSRHADRTLTGLMIDKGGYGSWPTDVPWRQNTP